MTECEILPDSGRFTKVMSLLQIWDDMMFLGMHKMIAAELWDHEVFELNLLNKDKEDVPGSVLIEITNTVDFTNH